MNIKKVILFAILYSANYTLKSVEPFFSEADVLRGYQTWKSHTTPYGGNSNAMQNIFLINASFGSRLLFNNNTIKYKHEQEEFEQKRSDRSNLVFLIINPTKYNAWYNENLKHPNLTNYISQGAGLVTFIAADHTIEKATDELTKFDSVKKITQNIPEKERTFCFNNGKMVLSAAFGRSAKILVEEGKDGFNSQNLQQFGHDAFRQVGAEVTSEYVAPKVADWVCGDKESLSKDTVKAIVNIGSFFLLTSLCKRK